MTARSLAAIAAELREWNTVPIQPGMVRYLDRLAAARAALAPRPTEDGAS